jgi:hypothetical protein
MGSRAIGLVIRDLSKEAEFYGNGPQMHRNLEGDGSQLS